MKKLVITSLIIAVISLTGCGAKNQTVSQTQPQTKQVQQDSTVKSSVASDTTATATGGSDVGRATLKNSTPVNVNPETVKKSSQTVTKASDKMSSIDSTLNSIGDFTIIDNSGLK